MKPREGKMLLVIALSFCGLVQVAAAQPGVAVNRPVSDSCASGNSSGITVHAAQRGAPFLNLCDGHVLGGSLARMGQVQPRALASGDFDEDGVPDLVSGFATGKGGMITVHRGNVNALWPYGSALRNGPPPEFLPNVRSFALPEAPDFIATGDFDADGHWDVVTAQLGSNALYFLRGDGHGGFGAPQRIPLLGNVTAMISGEINRTDGLTDLIVAVNTANGPRALVFESPMGALKGQPEMFVLPHPATALALGRFDGGAMKDLAVAAGNQIVLIHARDRKLSLSEAERASVAPAKVTRQSFPFAIRALTTGDFTGTGPSVAALGDDGSVHILEHTATQSLFGPQAMSDPNFRPTLQPATPGRDGKPVIVGATMTPSMTAKLAALRQAVKANSAEWTERSAVALPSGFAQAVPRLVTARVTGSQQEDILAVDSGNSKVHVLSTVSGASRVRSSLVNRGLSASTPASMSLLDSLDANSAPAAVLPMRLNQHGLKGLVILQAGQAEPTLMPQTVPPANVFTVTNTLDNVASPPDGSLRAAITNANNAFLGGMGNSSIVFDIPTTDPGYKPATGVFLIQPLSLGNGSDFALPPISATLTLDGYTQPGASPNTLANGDNAKILIQIDGGLATVPGGDGLDPFDDVGTTIRGFLFTNWASPDASKGVGESGGWGIQASGIGDYIEGNFIGTDVTGKIAQPNHLGIFVDNGPFNGDASGNIVGGTTLQARNLISGNGETGVGVLVGADEATVEGNWIGTDSTGAVALPNGNTGVTLNGSTVLVGGTLPGAANLISGQGNNVDINDLTNEGGANSSTVQGNLIGTDSTGTKVIGPQAGGISFLGAGVGILNNPQYMTIGGTTPAARNIISGNEVGVSLFDLSYYNTVQGNYIGVDVTGTKAIYNLNAGVAIGATTTNSVPAGDNTIGGSVPGAGNVISGNASDGVQMSGTSGGPNNSGVCQGNVLEGNFIGTDATGALSIPNHGNGVYLGTQASSTVIGGNAPGAGNLIANNTGNGVLIDPGAPFGCEGVSNNTIANTILSNGGAGVRINSGTNNLISHNSIFANGALGINLDGAGPNLNTPCQSTNTGANDMQNAPVLTAGSGTAFISATATDPSNNTSEFSNAVPASASGNLLSLLGNFNSLPNTTYTIEFFSSTAADPSGYGQGQTYLGSTTVTTSSTCTAPVDTPVTLGDADMSVVLGGAYLVIGPDFGDESYAGTVTNNGPATAHNVIFTDALPAGLEISSAYCDVGACQSPVTTTLGSCSVIGNTVTCNLGTMAPGTTATVHIPVQTVGTGSITNTATVSATEPDPKLANNTSSATANAYYSYVYIDHLSPASVLAGSPDLLLTIYGNGLTPSTMVTFNGSPLSIVAFLDNQGCGNGPPLAFCTALEVTVPASMLTTAGAPVVSVVNPNPGDSIGDPSTPYPATFTIASSCSYSEFSFLSESPSSNEIANSGTSLIAELFDVTANVQSCSWTATSTVPWAVVVADASATGNGTVGVVIAPNTGSSPRTGTITVAGQDYLLQQDPSATCDYELASSSANFTAAGGTGTIGITSACSAYYVQSYVPWITIPSSSGLLGGNATASYTVAANTGPPQTGIIVVGGAAFSVTEDAPSCYFTLSANSATLPTSGGTGSFGVTASPSTCAWTATLSSSPSISITSGASGTGNGTVNYSAPVNTGGPLTTTITVGTQASNAVYTVQQASAFSCTFAVGTYSAGPGFGGLSTVEVPANGTANFFAVTASYQNCQWTATSSDPTALTITLNPSGTGDGYVYYSVAQNTGGPRTLTITAGCETFTINQDGTAATNPVPAITTLLPTGATAGSGAFTLTVNGTGFVNGSVVNFNGNARTTTHVSATKITAAILAADVASVGTPAVTVTNPAPGGGTSNAVSFTVTAAKTTPTVTVAPSPTSITTTQALTVTIGVSGGDNPTPTGSVVLTSGSYTSAATTLGGGSATINVPAGSLATSTDTLTVTYTPDSASSATYNSATGSNTVTVTSPAKTTPTVTVTPSPTSITTAQALTVTVAVSGGDNPTPTGSVTLTSGSYTSAAATLSGGSATINVPAGSLATSTDTLTVTYTPDSASSSTYNSATGSNTVTVTSPAKTTPTVTVTPSPTSITTTQALTVTIGVSGGDNPTPTGSVVLTSGSYTSAATTLSGGSATINVPAGSLATSTDTLTVTYTPDSASSSTYNSATGSNTVTVTAAGVQITVGTTPAGLSFSVDGTSYTSTQTLSWTAGTSHTIATTSPQTNGGTQNTFASWSDEGAISHSVTAPSSAASYTATFNTSYQLTTAASPSSGGTVTPASGTYYASGTVVNLAATPNSGYTFSNWTGNVASASSATTTVTMTAPGGVTANFSAVVVPSFTIASSTGAQTVQPGGTAVYTIVVTAQNGAISNPVTLAASGLPPGATAAFSHTAVTPGSSSATSQLSIQTASTTAVVAGRGSGWPLAASALPLFGLLFATGKRRRRWITLAVFLFASLGALTVLSGCGGGFAGSSGAPATSYTITVTGTSGAEQQTTAVQLTVQ